MSAARSPSHLLLFDEALGDDLVDGRLHESGRDTPTPIALAVVDDPFGVVVDVGAELLEGTGQFLQHHVCGSSVAHLKASRISGLADLAVRDAPVQMSAGAGID
jgi:hypothetical protein